MSAVDVLTLIVSLFGVLTQVTAGTGMRRMFANGTMEHDHHLNESL
jgi:hypothetical protein